MSPSVWVCRISWFLYRWFLSCPCRLAISFIFTSCQTRYVLSIVWPSYSLRNDMAPSMRPVEERMIDTLLPSSYFLCSLPLLDTLDFKLMDGIDILLTIALLWNDGLEYFKQPGMGMILAKIAPKLPDQPSCDCTKFPICPESLAAIPRMVTKCWSR